MAMRYTTELPLVFSTRSLSSVPSMTAQPSILLTSSKAEPAGTETFAAWSPLNGGDQASHEYH